MQNDTETITTTPLKRSYILDTALVAFLLVIFTALPLGVQLSRGGVIVNDKLHTTRIVLTGLAWPFLVIGAIPLVFYWRKDRSIDKKFFSTATSSQLFAVFVCTMTVFLGCLFVLSAYIILVVIQFKYSDGISWEIVIDIFLVLIFVSISLTTLNHARNVHAVRKAIRNTPYVSNGLEINVEGNPPTFT